MTIKTYREAVKEALAQEMERDERVVLIGEDLRGGHGGNAPEEAKIEAFGGVLGVTKGCGRSSAPIGDRHAHYRVGHHRYGGRRRSDGFAAGRGIDVHGFFWREPRCTVQPGG